MPPEFIEELATLQDHVPPLTEEQVVVQVMEQELGVPWEDVFETIEPEPLAAGTIAAGAPGDAGDGRAGGRQGPATRRRASRSSRTSALLEVFAEKVGDRPGLRQVIDMEAVFEHLSTSLHRELDFRQEAGNIERMREVLAEYPRLAVPDVLRDLSTSRLLVMHDVRAARSREAPGGPARDARPRGSCSSPSTSRSWSTGSSTPTRTRAT